MQLANVYHRSSDDGMETTQVQETSGHDHAECRAGRQEGQDQGLWELSSTFKGRSEKSQKRRMSEAEFGP